MFIPIQQGNKNTMGHGGKEFLHGCNSFSYAKDCERTFHYKVQKIISKERKT